MLWAIGFLITFLFGGLTGIILSSPALDFHVSDCYFVVAHFHYVVFGTVVFAMFAGFYFWWPKLTGRMLDERLGKIHFWMLFIGFHMTFLIQHWLGVEGMPRRYADYLPERRASPGRTRSPRSARSCSAPRRCRSSTTSGRPGARRRWSRPTTRGATAPRWSGRRPARRRGTTSRRIPRIRSERPAFDLHHPEVASRRSDAAWTPTATGLDAAVGGPDVARPRQAAQDRRGGELTMKVETLAVRGRRVLLRPDRGRLRHPHRLGRAGRPGRRCSSRRGWR